MRTLLPQCMQIRLQNGRSYTAIAEFQDAVQKLDRQLSMWDEIHIVKNEKPALPSTRQSRFPAIALSKPFDRFSKSRQTVQFEDTPCQQRPPPLVRKLQALGACFDCGPEGHSRLDSGRPCKDRRSLSNDQISKQLSVLSTNLAIIGVDIDQEEQELEEDSYDNREDEQYDEKGTSDQDDDLNPENAYSLAKMAPRDVSACKITYKDSD
ncbi:hypothetical protein K402DRAFT_422283 [Aulographum hederae CBS 113979]|uniref:Uncharacterized protein n=1 Tax=Aulographum hederae CBS 113979 TaxID=1176131 RepID=A0A6G1GVJ8_9PEZI|nr:hypothetical protein K402DRAFT_422283 [Aulographum hederae CBS 113979]